MKYSVLIVFILGMFLITGCAEESGVKQDNEDNKPADSETIKTEKKKQKVIVFFGNSLSAGYGLKPEQSFPALIQDRIDSLGYPYEVVNAGVSGETTSGGDSRVDWVLRQPVDIFVLELGGNDGLRGIPPEESKKNLRSIIEKVRAQYPEAAIILAGMEAPPNMGPEFTAEFRRIYPELAAEQKVTLIPFLLEGVGGEPGLNQADGIHPNVEGAKIVADNVWDVLDPMLEKNPDQE